jgi:nitrous oxide reductase accessory protein NosL
LKQPGDVSPLEVLPLLSAERRGALVPTPERRTHMMQTVLWYGALLSLGFFFATSVLATAKEPDVPLRPGERDRCPVCGMLVAPYPEWTGQVRHGNGETVFFDGNKDLFTYLLKIDRYAPEKKSTNVATVFVTNYYDGEAIAARTAFFVIGSDVMGPMGPELVSHRTVEAAEDFMADHKGKQILRFDEISEETLRNLQ